MKSQGNGQAKVLTPGELQSLFEVLNENPRDACLFAICFYCACRISEALQLTKNDFIENSVILRKQTTKGKFKSRVMPISTDLSPYLTRYSSKNTVFLFPGKLGMREYLSRKTADKVLRIACLKAGIDGVSTHSFRRTALTYMYRSNVPLRDIQEISGHQNLDVLQKYLEVDPADLVNAIATVKF